MVRFEIREFSYRTLAARKYYTTISFRTDPIWPPR